MGDERRPLGKPKEVAEHVGLSVNTLYDQRRRGVGVGALAIKVGRHLRWSWDDVERLLAEQRR